MKSVNEFLDAPVYAVNGREVGKVDDIIVNEFSGRIEYISIQPADEKKHMRVRLTWQELKGDDEKNRLLINMPSSATKRLLLD